MTSGRLLLVSATLSASVTAGGCSDSERPIPAVYIDEQAGLSQVGDGEYCFRVLSSLGGDVTDRCAPLGELYIRDGRSIDDARPGDCLDGAVDSEGRQVGHFWPGKSNDCDFALRPQAETEGGPG